MSTRRITGRGVAVTMVLAASLWMSPGNAGANPLTQSGSVSVAVQGTPEDMQFVLTVNGQDYDNTTVDNEVGGTLTLSWEASQDEPTTSIKDCPGKKTGRRIALQGATPSTKVWATWISPNSQVVTNPIPIQSLDGMTAASVCEKPGNGNGNGKG